MVHRNVAVFSSSPDSLLSPRLLVSTVILCIVDSVLVSVLPHFKHVWTYKLFRTRFQCLPMNADRVSATLHREFFAGHMTLHMEERSHHFHYFIVYRKHQALVLGCQQGVDGRGPPPCCFAMCSIIS